MLLSEVGKRGEKERDYQEIEGGLERYIQMERFGYYIGLLSSKGVRQCTYIELLLGNLLESGNLEKQTGA